MRHRSSDFFFSTHRKTLIFIILCRWKLYIIYILRKRNFFFLVVFVFLSVFALLFDVKHNNLINSSNQWPEGEHGGAHHQTALIFINLHNFAKKSKIDYYCSSRRKLKIMFLSFLCTFQTWTFLSNFRWEFIIIKSLCFL
jgi:hypothetical protein